MKLRLWPGSLAWQTLIVMVVALVVSQAASLWLLREYVTNPRQSIGIGQFVSHLKTISAALETMPDGQERVFIQKLAEKEGIRVFPVRGNEPGRPAPDVPGVRLFRERIKALFGADADVFIRPGAPGAFWIRLPAGQRDYWVAFPRNRIERDTSEALVYWGFAGIAIALLAALFMAWRLSRPLNRLSLAAMKLGKGEDPGRIPEDGPGEVREVAQAFNKMHDDLKRSDRERATFLAGVSHDLRTPLSRLRLGIEMLGDKDPQMQRELAGDIEDINAIIDQFLDFARGESAEAPVAGDLNDIARAAAERFTRGGAQVKCELGGVPRLRLRPVAIQRLVENLVGNAVRHAGGDIVIRTARQKDELVLSVLDRGPGIPPGEIERLKMPFTRLDDARSGASGAGLGLAIVDRIARMHKGRFDILPREGGGLECRVSLPIAG
jgi:two-component system osmolarity sensor histidine kinase EnvZ